MRKTSNYKKSTLSVGTQSNTSNKAIIWLDDEFFPVIQRFEDEFLKRRYEFVDFTIN